MLRAASEVCQMEIKNTKQSSSAVSDMNHAE
jgi:hypothetical protein